MIDTRIETFLTLCRVMNYRKTAELLNMTQPAVTQHIHFLEEQYGCKLFSYDRRTLTMTKEAELLQKYAENVLYQEKKLKAELEHSDGVSLSIGATKTIGEYVIDKHISAFLSVPKNSISVNGKVMVLSAAAEELLIDSIARIVNDACGKTACITFLHDFPDQFLCLLYSFFRQMFHCTSSGLLKR